ncbi:hypothetical protein CGCTS75_v008850 [Colletotrichum tropicale]|nr:hypothetical protein CGCTS75_v008850 [Colletotrichum tropicale]
MSTPTDTPTPESSTERSRWACEMRLYPACMFDMRGEGAGLRLLPQTAPRAHQSGSSSRAGMIRRLQQVEQMVQSLTPGNTVENAVYPPSSRQLHVSPLAHLGFDNLCEESYITDPDVLYRLVRRDALPMARIGAPDQPVVKFRYQIFLESVNNDFQFFRNEEIEILFQNYVQGQSCSSQCAYAAISMVCACASWTLHGTQNAMTERLVENAMRVLPAIMMEVPDTLSVGTLLLVEFCGCNFTWISNADDIAG